MTRSAAVIAVTVIACGTPSRGPEPPPSNATPQPQELRCKTAIERASSSIKLGETDVTTAIGTCEQKEWSAQARQCIAAAHASADLVACAKTYELGKTGIFTDHMSLDKAVATMARFRDQMCACKDSACAQHVSDDMTKWGQEMSKDQEEPPRMTEEDTKRVTAIGESMGKCMQAAMSTP